MSSFENYSAVLLGIDLWREARGQSHEIRVAKAWVIRNRVLHPGWWGETVIQVITHKWQFSGMTAPGDPNLIKWPQEDPISQDCFVAADEALSSAGPDPTNGATLYYDPPLTSPPAEWGTVTETAQFGSTHFFKGPEPK